MAEKERSARIPLKKKHNRAGLKKQKHEEVTYTLGIAVFSGAISFACSTMRSISCR